MLKLHLCFLQERTTLTQKRITLLNFSVAYFLTKLRCTRFNAPLLLNPAADRSTFSYKAKALATSDLSHEATVCKLKQK